MNKKYTHISKSNEELIKQETKESLMDDVKRLLKTASKFSNNNTISNFTKTFVKHILLTLSKYVDILFKVQ